MGGLEPEILSPLCVVMYSAEPEMHECGHLEEGDGERERLRVRFEGEVGGQD